MPVGLVQKIVDREISVALSARKAYKDLYGSHQLIKELDIVAELQGHTGCVNALCWSKSGNLLASGSDDQHINIHAFQQEDSDKQFRMHTTVATGHSANIFSVKFMPHSNDRIVLSCAGDGDVRIFDLEYDGKSTEASAAAARATAGRTAGQSRAYDGIRYLSDGNTNSRVYRSHADRAKRIVVEDSPYLFLTCGEDGDVRQWDIRQPSSYYPSPQRGGHNVPPPLISYRHWQLDLNTISCSASQPHYIALGGAHIHCFLHDRRMAGRDRLAESGRPAGRPRTQADDDAMSQATRCVRRFAPNREQGTAPGSRGHITACKISDARPDEMIISWSNDHIYSFDLIRGPEGPTEQPSRLKRKRRHNANESEDNSQNTTLRVSYGNGQQEDIEIADDTIFEDEAARITKAVLDVRESFFALSDDTTAIRFSPVLTKCADLLQDIDQLIRDWTYPMDPTPAQVTRHKSLRYIRESVRRCIQAVGTVSRVLIGQTYHPALVGLHSFVIVINHANDLPMNDHDRFIFDFVKAICVWLDSGTGKLIESFTRPSSIAESSKMARRLPIPQAGADADSVEHYLGTYLVHIAPDRPIVDPETNRFEVDETRIMWHSPVDAVIKFTEECSRPFADSGATDGVDRQDARQTWCLRVARGLMLQAFQNVDFELVEIAFGGRRTISVAELARFRDPNEVLPPQAASIQSGNGSAPPEADGSVATINDDMTDDDDEEDTEYYDMEEDSSEPDEEDGVPNLGPPRYMFEAASAAERRRQLGTVNGDVPCSTPMMSFVGAANSQTVKDCNYFGLEDEYVVAGSDDGNFFIWDRKTGDLVNVLHGDTDVVNVIQGHPYEPALAVSGIDHTVKIFSPDHQAREAARLGFSASTARQPSTAWPHAGRRHRSTQSSDLAPAIDRDDDAFVAANGLHSRQRWEQRDQIVVRNSRSSRRGNDEIRITRSMLMQLARHMQEQRAAQGGDAAASLLDGVEMITDEDGEVRMAVSDDCSMM